ncbi:MAG TPA: HEAT repeat domain-containing protein [Actinomycetota bacterium]
MQRYCPGCFGEVEDEERCPACGTRLGEVGASFEEKLIRALDHRLPDRRVLAARILGELGASAAVPRLAELAVGTDDLYLAAEAARALARIDPHHPALRALQDSGPLLVRSALQEVGVWR